MRTNEFTVSPDERRNRELVLRIPTSFQEYLDPNEGTPIPDVAAPVPPVDHVPDVPAVDIHARRLRLQMKDLEGSVTQQVVQAAYICKDIWAL